MQSNYNYVKKKRAQNRKMHDPSHFNQTQYKLDFEDLSENEDEPCKAQILRPAWEIDAELFKEDIAHSQKNKNNTKHRAFYGMVPQVNKVVVNEIDYV